MNGNRGYSCLSFGVNLATDALRAFYTTAQKAKDDFPQFEATGIMRIGIQKAAFQIPLQNTVQMYSRMSF